MVSAAGATAASVVAVASDVVVVVAVGVGKIDDVAADADVVGVSVDDVDVVVDLPDFLARGFDFPVVDTSPSFVFLPNFFAMAWCRVISRRFSGSSAALIVPRSPTDSDRKSLAS